MFNLTHFFKKGSSRSLENTHTKGYIGYYELTDWWHEVFTEEEKKRIIDAYKPLDSAEDNPLTEENVTGMSLSVAGFLWSLSSWFEGPNDRDIARKILQKAEEINPERGIVEDVLDKHFTLSQAIKIHYRDRKIDNYYQKAIEYCRRQIDLAPQAKDSFLKKYPEQGLPSHVGYKQLVVILDKERKWIKAIELCKKAKQEGWSGDWDNRIARYKAKSSR
ncbi:MAG: hypothetical protein WD000_00345 [Thermodesulfobacteriota bacterium]